LRQDVSEGGILRSRALLVKDVDFFGVLHGYCEDDSILAHVKSRVASNGTKITTAVA
jgi:hypothetical protein